MVLRALLKFFVPGGLILLTAIIFDYFDFFSKWYMPLMHFYPYAIFALGLLLGWRFNRSRLLFAIIVFTIADRVLNQFPALLEAAEDNNKLIINVLSLLLPINLIFLAFIKERGIITLKGLGRLALIMVQPVIVYALIQNGYIRVFNLLDHSFIKSSFLNHFHVSQPVLAIFIISLAVLLVILIIRKNVIESGFFWAMTCSFLALSSSGSESTASFYFSTSGLILIMSMLESSYMMAFRDELTSLPGRRALQEAFLRLANNFTISMVDIDKFKKFNDRYGHDVGDQVLRMVASNLNKVGGGGKAFRYGGEEFTVLFPNKSIKEARDNMENLRRTIASTAFVIRSAKRPRTKPENLKNVPKSEKKVKITVSIGMAERDERYTNPHDVINAADMALYRAKSAGRNCIRTSVKYSRKQ